MKKTQIAKQRFNMIVTLLKGSVLMFVISLIASMLNNVFNAMIPQVIRITVDSVVGVEEFDMPDILVNIVNSFGGRDFLRLNLYWCAVAVLVVAFFAGVFNYICRDTIARGSETFIQKLRNNLFEHIQKLPYSWHIKHQTGDIIQRCTSDTEVVRRFIASQLLEVFKISFLIIFSVVIMWSMNPQLTLISIVFIPIVVAYSTIFFKKIARKFKSADEKEGELSSVVQENLTGIRVVRAFGREAYELKRFDEKNENFANAWIKMGHTNGYFWGIGDMFTALQIMSIIVIGTIFAVDGKITSGDFIAFVSYNSSLVWPIRTLGRVLVDMSKAFVSIDRINYILEAQEEVDNLNSITPPMDKDIEFKNINFAYVDEHVILKNINFKIKAGQTFGILGSTGSGKSTLMHLLNRLYALPDDCGQITVGGVNINAIKMDWLRANIGMVLQEPFLFSRSIKENIAITKPHSSMEDIEYNSSIACIDDSIKNFTHGYDTIVGERGVTLSGGQKQRVAIARMLMQNTPIMVFDDSLSAVDNETDVKIRRALKEKLQNCTVILISHRITTLMQADNILVLDGGEISQIGTHKELISKTGIYQDIYKIQMNPDDKSL